MVRRLLVCALAGLVVLGLVGCKSVSEKIGEKVGEEIAGKAIGGDVNVEGDKVTVETEDGSVTVEGDTGKIPQDFPKDFPLYSGYEVDSTSSISGDADTTYYISITSKDKTGDIYDWYKSEFTSGGWKITGDVKMSDEKGDTAMITAEKDKMQATVTISPGDSVTDIGIILIVKK